MPVIAGGPGGDVFLHLNNLGPFSVGSIVRCAVYWHEGKPQAKNLEEASPSEGEEVLERIASGGMTDMSMIGTTSITGAAGMAGMTTTTGMTTGPGMTAVDGRIPDTELGRFMGTARSSVGCFQK